MGIGVGDRLSQYETSCLASYSRIAARQQLLCPVHRAIIVVGFEIRPPDVEVRAEEVGRGVDGAQRSSRGGSSHGAHL